MALAILLALLVAARLAMAPVLLRFANQKLDQIPDYHGHIGDLGISLLRGAYRIQDVQLLKTQGQEQVPFFAAKAVDLSVERGALIRHHSLVGEIELIGPRLNFLVAPTKKESQTGIDASWQHRVEEFFPLRINRFAIHDGEIHFRDISRAPRVDVHVDRIEALAKGLTNHPRGEEALPATFHASARAMEHAKLRLDLKLDPIAKSPTFDMEGQSEGLRLVTLNDFLKAYAKVDAEGGTFSLYTEMAAKGGAFKG